MAGVLAAAARRATSPCIWRWCPLRRAGSRIRRRRIVPLPLVGAGTEALEVTDRPVGLTEWRLPDGGPASLADIPFGDDELLPPDAFDGLEPDEEHFHEATGNEGASFERTYRRAALVLWPNARFLAVLNQAGLSVTLPYLEELTKRWEQLAGCNRLRCGIRGTNWPVTSSGTGRSGWRHDETPGPAARLLTALTRLADTESIAAFWPALPKAAGLPRATPAPWSRRPAFWRLNRPLR